MDHCRGKTQLLAGVRLISSQHIQTSSVTQPTGDSHSGWGMTLLGLDLQKKIKAHGGLQR
jgi:hypothetical protein